MSNKLLESLAFDVDLEDAFTTSERIAFSQAISLKRIADALDGLKAVDPNVISNILWELGRSFGAGIEIGRRQ